MQRLHLHGGAAELIFSFLRSPDKQLLLVAAFFFLDENWLLPLVGRQEKNSRATRRRPSGEPTPPAFEALFSFKNVFIVTLNIYIITN